MVNPRFSPSCLGPSSNSLVFPFSGDNWPLALAKTGAVIDEGERDVVRSAHTKQRNLSTEIVDLSLTCNPFPHITQGCGSNYYCQWNFTHLNLRQARFSKLPSRAAVEKLELFGLFSLGE